VVALKAGINKRFEQLLNQPDAQLAAVVNPRFKCDWVPSDALKLALIDQMKKCVRTLSHASNTADQTTESPVTSESDTVCNVSDLFTQVSSARKQRIKLESSGDDAGAEVVRYLADCSAELSSLHWYPTIKQLYLGLKLNSGLPASAAAGAAEEHLFSLGGGVFTPLCTTLY
jgi:hypothetical protein